MHEVIVVGAQRGPVFRRRNRLRRLRCASFDARDQRFFLAEPPHLPESETDQQNEKQRRRNCGPQKRARSSTHD
jgi:hypothetical protein